MTPGTLTNPAEPATVPASTDERVYILAELMEVIDWDPFVRRCLGYARFRRSCHGAAAARYEMQPNDCVQEAIRLTLEGRRHFEYGTESQFFVFICGVMDSLISHDGEKTRRHAATTAITMETTDDSAADELMESHLSSGEDIERAIVFRDDLERFLEWVEADLAAYARLRSQEVHSTAKELADVLTTTVADIRNKDRRLRRRREEWMNRSVTMQRPVM